jgi:hypothetical protein
MVTLMRAGSTVVPASELIGAAVLQFGAWLV